MIQNLLTALEKELKENELYLRQVGRFYSLYQDRRYQRIYDLLEQIKLILATNL